MNNFLTLTISKRQLILLIAAVFMALQMSLLLLTSSVTSAAPDGKVFVCKYIGKPGADERLQTGQNPISVSVNAIKDYKGVGSYFNDKQGRSYVLMVDDKDKNTPEPAASACPASTTNNPGNNPGGNDDNGAILGESTTQASAAAGGVGAGFGGGADSIIASIVGLTASLGALGYGAVNLLRRNS